MVVTQMSEQMALRNMEASALEMPVAAKRTFDLFAILLTLPVVLPIFAALAALLLMQGGPVFFSQVRVGRHGRRFRCWKFRTMRPDAEERLQEILDCDPVARAEWARYQKLRNDPRLTPTGRFLRRTSLDELPQLINVLLGDMTLVGPRPIVAPEAHGYSADRAYYESAEFSHYRRCVPGLTGLWQVSGRNKAAHSKRIRLDRWYARHHSISLDMAILIRTIPVVIGCSGSH